MTLNGDDQCSESASDVVKKNFVHAGLRLARASCHVLAARRPVPRRSMIFFTPASGVDCRSHERRSPAAGRGRRVGERLHLRRHPARARRRTSALGHARGRVHDTSADEQEAFAPGRRGRYSSTTRGQRLRGANACEDRSSSVSLGSPPEPAASSSSAIRRGVGGCRRRRRSRRAGIPSRPARGACRPSRSRPRPTRSGASTTIGHGEMSGQRRARGRHPSAAEGARPSPRPGSSRGRTAPPATSSPVWPSSRRRLDLGVRRLQAARRVVQLEARLPGRLRPRAGRGRGRSRAWPG